MRLRLAAEAAGPVASRRTGKKKTLPELKIMEESLLRDRVELRKALEEQKKILVVLREENLKITKLKSDLAEAERSKNPQWNPGARQTVEDDVSGRQGFLIDLNCTPEEEDQ
ncbi:unnamed protein product [Spirodela intermedia]|uniref:Uncharacterized protein n=1 Tax=Spirodela intermedia TaxID=51605 RepID=A0A7I8LFJ1_SPIIN|nr:unnamed protein product [Spirodela intermedia]